MIVINQNGVEQIVQPTLFPDGTSQVWQLELDAYKNLPVKIIWQFEQEAELIWVNQLISLLKASNIAISELFIPYLPYARQDKCISNQTTFAKEIFLDMLFLNQIEKVSTLDAHSQNEKVMSYSPKRYIEQSIDIFKPDVLVFPDHSAYLRYAKIIDVKQFEIVVLEKVRNQSTGTITTLTLNTQNTSASLMNGNKDKRYNMLIIDDICDGGATFINASLFIHTHYRCELGLYVTHGIFSKGFEHLISAGISKFYTTQSLTKNKAGFALKEIQNDI